MAKFHSRRPRNSVMKPDLFDSSPRASCLDPVFSKYQSEVNDIWHMNIWKMDHSTIILRCKRATYHPIIDTLSTVGNRNMTRCREEHLLRLFILSWHAIKRALSLLHPSHCGCYNIFYSWLKCYALVKLRWMGLIFQWIRLNYDYKFLQSNWFKRLSYQPSMLFVKFVTCSVGNRNSAGISYFHWRVAVKISKAFDFVNHMCHPKRLKITGVGRAAIVWLDGFLSRNRQRVRFWSGILIRSTICSNVPE